MKKIISTAQRIFLIALCLISMAAGEAALGGSCFSREPSLLPGASAAVIDLTSGSSQEDTLNILLIGQDRREGESTARSDSMILCTFSKSQRKLTLTSFLRDLYVKIPGFGSNRLNAAYAFGGADLLERTLEQNFGLCIDGSAEVDFSCFPKIIDVLGGVPIDLRSDEADWINLRTGSSLAGGSNLLTGQQALVYARIRNLDADGDFSRTQRQRKVLIALLDGYQDAGLIKGLSLVKTLIPYISTDMSGEDILSHARTYLPLLSGLRLSSQTIPAAGTYSCRRIQGMDVLVADAELIKNQLKQTIGS